MAVFAKPLGYCAATALMSLSANVFELSGAVQVDREVRTFALWFRPALAPHNLKVRAL